MLWLPFLSITNWRLFRFFAFFLFTFGAYAPSVSIFYCPLVFVPLTTYSPYFFLDIRHKLSKCSAGILNINLNIIRAFNGCIKNITHMIAMPSTNIFSNRNKKTPPLIIMIYYRRGFCDFRDVILCYESIIIRSTIGWMNVSVKKVAIALKKSIIG